MLTSILTSILTSTLTSDLSPPHCVAAVFQFHTKIFRAASSMPAHIATRLVTIRVGAPPYPSHDPGATNVEARNVS
eukprot:3578469-Amphidinium_carterae.1